MDVRIIFKDRSMRVTRVVGSATAPHALMYVERNCFANCVSNQPAMEALAGEPLEVVAGSLGVCSPEPVWYEWGGAGSKPHETVAQFVKCAHTGLRDVHFWLRGTRTGTIWDVLDPYLLDVVAPAHAKIVTAPPLGLVAGETREDLESRRGLRYLPATAVVNQVLVRRYMSELRFVAM